MALEIPKWNFSGKIRELTLGATSAEGGTRGERLTVGNSNGLPFHDFESETKNPLRIGMDIVDTTRVIDDRVKQILGDAIQDPVVWAKKCESDWGAEFIVLKLLSANPEEENRSPEDCASLVQEILKAVKLPLIVYGCGTPDKDSKVMEAVSAAAAGERIFLGPAEEDNYKSLAAAAMSNGHGLVGFSNLDINIAKQMVILLTEFGVKQEDILTDPLQAALGMGIEYTYSVIERLRQGALMGDVALQTPIICDCSIAWGAREALDEDARLGKMGARAINWEVVTAVSSLVAGADLLVVRHEESLRRTKAALASLQGGG